MKKTPLFEQHVASNAMMVDFHGWEMPLHYGSQLDEHNWVRKDAGMFDVSHMTVVDLLGAGARQFLRFLLANDVDKLKHVGKALYSCMLNQHGGIVDDLIVYLRAPDNYRLVLNSATREKDLSWIRKMAEGFSVGIQERPEWAMLAIQGPLAIEKTSKALTPAHGDAIATLQAFEGVDVDDMFLARTGYTGEDGLELILPKEDIKQLWEDLLTQGVKPCGLGARDTLRLEAGMMLYGQDMNDSTTPFESGLNWTVCLEEDRTFIGKDALVQQKQQGVNRKVVGLLLEGKGIMRSAQKVITNEGEGIITSGSYSPTLGRSIALARVPSNIGETCSVEIRGKSIEATVLPPRFVKQGKALPTTLKAINK